MLISCLLKRSIFGAKIAKQNCDKANLEPSHASFMRKKVTNNNETNAVCTQNPQIACPFLSN